jgi:hypothetical protein
MLIVSIQSFVLYIICSVLHLVLVFIYFRAGGIASKISLILEMGELCEGDVKEYFASAKQIKIIFEQSSDLICLVDKVLPKLFGEVFQVTTHTVHDMWIKMVINF